MGKPSSRLSGCAAASSKCFDDPGEPCSVINRINNCANTPFGPLRNKTVIFSEGKLYLDECDFSGSSAAVLVYAGQEDHTVIRNTMLGEMNCE